MEYHKKQDGYYTYPVCPYSFHLHIVSERHNLSENNEAGLQILLVNKIFYSISYVPFAPVSGFSLQIKNKFVLVLVSPT